uniref:Uncharacterized protein n=1 Tax=uncultured Verrucomicrobiales bacterium HF0200_39L05 TaxID=710997 RepID=E0XUQ9_9BACT|nr:hypothetical protein [uncultured Verrucomicrobiales bacterium HF0200_39L05]
MIWLIRAALVKLRLSARSQKTLRLSICISPIKLKICPSQTFLMQLAGADGIDPCPFVAV